MFSSSSGTSKTRLAADASADGEEAYSEELVLLHGMLLLLSALTMGVDVMMCNLNLEADGRFCVC